MFTRVVMVVTSVRCSVSTPRKCPTTVDIITSSTSQFTSNHVDQDAKEDFVNVCEITKIIGVLNLQKEERKNDHGIIQPSP